MTYAHSSNDRGSRQELVAHLKAVAAMAARFAVDFGASEAAYYLGLWHDIGKFAPAFQDYLLGCETASRPRRRGPEHKAAGALLARQHLYLNALLVQGHHGGLKTPNDVQAWLAQREADPSVGNALIRARQALPELDPRQEVPLPHHILADARAAEIFMRLLFSALVDADFLDTEQHFAPAKAERRSSEGQISALWARFAVDQRRFAGKTTNVLGQARREIYEACLAAAELPPGIFRLSVPTGGGKTRSGMAFALRHALRYGQRRVIVAVPFISITEQTADVYRGIFEANGGAPVVLEHHSAAIADAGEGDDFGSGEVWGRLAAENWDAPIVVTTTVQLFESLFGNSTSTSRKVHNFARSVIILDEAQALPPPLLAPILDALRQLSTHYGTTVVISTATQPAFEAIPVFAEVPAREIVPDPARFFSALRRVSYEWRTDCAMPWTEVADVLHGERQGLAVLNTKKDALALLDALGDPSALHLSTLLCGAHRREVIKEVRRRLAAGERCRLATTQVVEAGVDLDFPLVLRALGPLDAVIQAAGRCNREGRMARGRVIVFRPKEGGMPEGTYSIACRLTGALLGTGNLDAEDPAWARLYFERLFQTVTSDAKGIQKLRAELNYPEVSRRFRMIEDDTVSVAVRYGSDAEQQGMTEIVEQLRQGTPNARVLLRRLQQHLVTLRRRQADRYARDGLIVPVLPGLGEWLGGYDAVRGLIGGDPEPDALVV